MEDGPPADLFIIPGITIKDGPPAEPISTYHRFSEPPADERYIDPTAPRPENEID